MQVYLIGNYEDSFCCVTYRPLCIKYKFNSIRIFIALKCVLRLIKQSHNQKQVAIDMIQVIIIETVKKPLEPMEDILMQRVEFSVSCGMWIKNQTVVVRGEDHSRI